MDSLHKRILFLRLSFEYICVSVFIVCGIDNLKDKEWIDCFLLSVVFEAGNQRGTSTGKYLSCACARKDSVNICPPCNEGDSQSGHHWNF